MAAPYELGVAEAAAEIAAGRLSPVELTASVLARLEETEPVLHAFAHVTAERATADGARCEAELARGASRGPLHGIPLGVKDLYDTAGIPTTSSSRVRAGHVPDADAAVVERLHAAGTVLVGKTHTHEFAYGITTPTTRNPWDPARIPGGSSGGSGAAVAAGSCLVGLGSDTAGSIRIPASLCGTVGLKPTYGRASRRGVASLSWSLDHVGPLTRSVEDAALVLGAMAGHDRLDPASLDVPVPDYTAGLRDGVAGLRVGVPANFFFDRVQGDVETAVRRAVDALADQGAQVREVQVPYADAMLAAEYAILLPEASDYHAQSLRAGPELYGEDVRTLLEVGELVLATDYVKALRVRTLVQRGWADMFADLDVLVAPATPVTAPAAGDAEVTYDDGSTEDVTIALVRLALPGNLTGLPVLSLPVGHDRAGLPIGLQVVGRPFDEATVLRVGHACEAAAGARRLAPL